MLSRLFEQKSIDAVVHLAGFSQVFESMQIPTKYFDNNVFKTSVLLDSMVQHRVKNIVFSSSAAIYGIPKEVPITEDHLPDPNNFYGETKLMVEKLLRWYDQIYGLKYISLRYFNAAGADESSSLGEQHDPETHLLPIIIQYILNIRRELIIYGDDYATADGTCVRDYIHVSDLAAAHLLCLNALLAGTDSAIYNLGNGSGYSIKQVIDTAAQIIMQPVHYSIGTRRTGDPPVLIASSDKISRDLGFKPRYNDLATIIKSALSWHKTLLEEGKR